MSDMLDWGNTTQCTTYSKKTTISRNNVTKLDSNHITGNKFSSFHCVPFAIALDFTFGSKRFHKSLDSIASLTFFIKANQRVGEQKEDDTNKIRIIWWLAFTIGYSNRDNSSSFHDPRQWVPHEAQELQEGIGFLLNKLVRTKLFNTTSSFISSQTLLGSSIREEINEYNDSLKML